MNINSYWCSWFHWISCMPKALLKKKINVYGIDDLNNYYDVSLKEDRLVILKKYKNFTFIKKKLKIKILVLFLK